MADSIIGPTSHYFYSQRLKLHYVDWGNPGRPLLVLVHGGRDHCRNWDWVALDLRDHFHIIAPDLRGHGDSDWAVGSGYSMIDYVLDLSQLMRAIGNEPATLIGHSLGGGIVLQYTGTHPDAVKRVVSIEGMGPPPGMIKDSRAHASSSDLGNPPQRERHLFVEVRQLRSRDLAVHVQQSRRARNMGAHH